MVDRNATFSVDIKSFFDQNMGNWERSIVKTFLLIYVNVQTMIHLRWRANDVKCIHDFTRWFIRSVEGNGKRPNKHTTNPPLCKIITLHKFLMASDIMKLIYFQLDCNSPIVIYDHIDVYNNSFPFHGKWVSMLN